MKVFISYASEQRDLAERIALGLKGEGHTPFFDRSDLPTGEAFDGRIRSAVGATQLFLFLISADAMRSGAYTLTELGFAQRRWPHPQGRVLPVVVDDSPVETWPAYVRSISVLKPGGDVVAEVLDAVANVARRRRRARLLRATGGMVVAVMLVLVWLWLAADSRDPSGEQHASRLQLSNVVQREAEASTAEEPVYRVTAELSNPEPHSVTVISLRAESRIDDLRFSSSNDWYSLASGDSVAVAFEGNWLGYYPYPDFEWRICWVTLDTEILYQNPDIKGAAFQLLLIQQGREGCGGWMYWHVAE